MLDKKDEAIGRMKILKLDKKIIDEYSESETIYVSENQGQVVKANEEQMKILREYEEMRNVKIYHIIRVQTNCKDILYFLYVGNNNQNWNAEKRDNELGFAEALCYKKTKEFREIGLRIRNGKVNVVV